MKVYKISQRNLNCIWVPLIVFVVFLMAAGTWNLKKAASERQDIQDRRLLCGELCDNLEEAANYLSEQARNYVITGNPDCLEGYWKEIHTGKRREDAFMKLEKVGISEKRIRLLKSAKNYSDLLIYLETRAMRLAADTTGPSGIVLPPEVEGYILNIVEKSMNPEEKHVAAVELLFGETYLSEKKVIGQYTRQFLRQAEEELDGELERADKRVSGALTWQWSLQAASVMLFMLMVLSYYRLVIRPVLSYHSCLNKENKECLKPSGIQEIHMLGESINRALKAKDDFLAAMSHEIRTPLNSVIGYETLLERTNLDQSQKECVLRMKYASQHLLEMVSHLLDYARIKNSGQKLFYKTWMSESLLLYLEHGFRHLAAEKKLGFKLRKEGDIPPVLLGDEGKIRQIAANLVSNAVKFTEKGSVEVTLSWKKEPDSTKEGSLLLVVKDTGPGITPGDLERVFEPFEQAADVKSGQYRGTGLGLPICRSLVAWMGGTVKACSTGTGSIFTAELPLQVGEGEGNSFLPDPAGRRVLLAEDDQVNQTMQFWLLSSLGLSVKAVSNGEKAIALYKKETFDLILMDLRMPVMDGYEAAEKIRACEHENGTHIPMIALTADGEDEVRDKVQRAGMDGILVKPVALDTLKEAVGRFVDMGKTEEEGSKGVKKELLHIYCLEHAEDFHALVDDIEEGKSKEAADLLHKLKGASAAVGAEDIRAACGTMEKYLKNPRMHGLVEIVRETEKKFTVWKRIDQKKQGEHGREIPMSGGKDMAEQIDAWRQMVARGEFKAMELWRENRTAFAAYLGWKKAEALETALGRYDYQKTLELLDKR